MSNVSVWFFASLLVGCCACASARPHTSLSAPTGAAGPGEPRSTESESIAWDGALDDARDAWATMPEGSPCLAIRFEGNQASGTSFRDAKTAGDLHARAWIDGHLIDTFTDTVVSGAPDIQLAEPVAMGKHTIELEVESLRRKIAVDVGASRSVVIRVHASTNGSELEVDSLDARRVSLVEKAELDMGRIDTDVRSLQTTLAATRGSIDAKRSRCLNDRLSQILVAKRAADEGRSDLSTAVLGGRLDVASQEGSKITMRRRVVERLASEGRDCVVPSQNLVAILSR